MSNFLIKISYKDEGYSNWKTEGNPIPLYSSEQEAFQQACAIYCREVDFNNLDPAISNHIQNLIKMGNYQQAVLEMNFSDTMRFIVLKTKVKNSDPILLNGVQLPITTTATVSPSMVGATCRKCSHHNDYATPDNNDGKYTCYACKI
jgi:hypothetical protein